MTHHHSQLRRWLLTGGMAVLLMAVALGSFIVGRSTRAGLDHTAHASPADASTHDHGNAADSPTIYYCSMHPEIRSDDPNDTCPICGMDLIPMPADADDDDRDLPILRLSERAARLLDIRTTPAERRPAHAQVRFVGSLEYDERRLTDIVARSDGYIETLHANYTWTPVALGQPLAEFYSPAVTAAAREMLLVHNGVRSERQAGSLEAAQARLRRMGVSRDQIEAMLEAGEAPETYELRSPIAGVVAELDVRAGDAVSDGGRLMRIADLASLWLQLEAFESDLHWLRIGQSATFSVQAFPGQTFEGVVSFINPIVNERTRTARVRLDVDNADGALKPGMFARGVIEAELSATSDAGRPHEQGGDAHEQPLLIPASAPLITGRRAVVYVRLPDTERPTFEGRQVVLGPRVNDHYVVLEGLEEGEQVVVRGAFKIDSELQIRGRPSMMARGELFGEQPDAQPRIPADHPAHTVNPAAVPDAFAAQVAAGLEQYLALTAALANDDLAAAREAVAAYHNHLLAVERDPLPANKRDAWQAVDAELHRPLHAMAEGDDLEAIRAHLEPLSDYTALAVQAFAAGRVASLHRVHCPMAFDNRGADWLQADTQINNPYFGASMLRCGVVEEDLLAPGDASEPSGTAPVADQEHASHQSPDDGLEPYPLDVCLVSGLPLDSMGGPARHQHDDREILFCCAACQPRFDADPDEYLPRLEQADPGAHQH